MPRGRPPNINPSRPLNTHLDESLMARVDLLLWSEVEARVPKGAYQTFLNERLREFFSTRTLDLAPFAGTLPGELVVRGKPFTLERLQSLLEGANDGSS